MFVRNKVFSEWRLLKQCKILFFKTVRLISLKMKNFFVLCDLFEWKNAFFPHKEYSTFNLNEMTESECLSEFRFGKRDILMG